VNHFLSFWQEGFGAEYNKSRHQALEQVALTQTLDEVIAAIEKKEGKKPLLIATSARSLEDKTMLSYYDQGVVWQQERPIMLIFGTGKGLADAVIAQCDYLLQPIHGLSEFNHLSVRSAVGIVLDRWIGLNEDISKKLPE
jgi:hypothetical protein